MNIDKLLVAIICFSIIAMTILTLTSYLIINEKGTEVKKRNIRVLTIAIISLLLIGVMLSYRDVKASQPRNVQETGILKIMDENPELSCGAIASMACGSTFVAGTKASAAVGTAFPPLLAPAELLAGAAAGVSFFYAYDVCVYHRNLRVKQRKNM